MKTKRFAKIVTLILSCALLVAGIVGITVSANDGEASAEFEVVTLNYGADVKIAYALNITGAEASDVALYLYKTSDLSDTPVVSNFSDSYYNTSYPVYYSMGVAAKDLADYIYAVPVLKSSGEAIGAPCRYSVAQYCYSILQDSAASADLVALAGDLLTYGASAQTRLINIGNIEDEPLVTEYSYVYTTDANVYVEENYKSAIVAPGETFVPVYIGADPIEGWSLVNKQGTTFKTVAEAAQGISVSAATKIEPLYFVPTVSDFEDGNITDDSVSHNAQSQTTITNAADPTGADNKVLKVETTALPSGGANRCTYIKVQTAAEGNCYVYESRMYVPSSASDVAAGFLYFYDTVGNVAFFIDYYYDTPTSEIVLRGIYQNSSSGKDVYTEIGRFAADKWVNIRIELYKSDVAEENCVKLYLGDSQDEMKYVGGLDNCARYPASVNANPISYLQFDHHRRTSYTVYFDDILFTRVEKKYTGEVFVADFEEGNANDDGITTNCGSQTTATNVDDPTGADNKVLKVTNTKVDGGSNSNSTIILQKVENGNCYVYESRMYVPKDEIYVAYIDIRDTANTTAFYLVYMYDAATESVLVQVRVNGKDQTIGSFALDKWINVRIELYKSAVAEENCVKLYCGESQDAMEYVGGIENCAYSVSENPLSYIAQEHFRKSSYTVYFDDVLFSRVDKEYTAEN